VRNILYCLSLLFIISCGNKNEENTEVKLDEVQKEVVMELKVGEEATTESGLKYEVITLGTGEKPRESDKVEVHYHGTLLDGTVFDSSVDRGETIKFSLNKVIKGWTEGLQLMPVGSKFKFTIPSKLAYGERKAGGIPPNSTLIFEVELFSIEKAFIDTDFNLPGKEEVTISGLRMIIHKEGSGEIAKVGQTVYVHYTGLLETGKKFDSSHDRGQPFSFKLGQGRVIKGWEEALVLMRPGEKRTLIIPPELGYGKRAAGAIPPNSILIFEIELVKAF